LQQQDTLYFQPTIIHPFPLPSTPLT
jgi:hypothetical protein